MTSDALEITPGIFLVEDDAGNGTLHVDLVAVCKELELEPTPENMLTVQKHFRETFSKLVPGVPMRLTASPCPFQSDPKGAEDVDKNCE